MEKMQFKAESKRLLDLMINSIYTHQEIFLREIISNASDAMDKLAYTALTDDKVGMSRDDFAITIHRDRENRTLTVSDNGIGMNREELEENLGTIAKSGSLAFKKDMEKAEDIDIIGQFGVGFYSAFMVASSVTVITKKYGEDTAWKWVSDGADGYTVEACEKDHPGTDIIMVLKEDTEEEEFTKYLEEYELRTLIKRLREFPEQPVTQRLRFKHRRFPVNANLHRLRITKRLKPLPIGRDIRKSAFNAAGKSRRAQRMDHLLNLTFVFASPRRVA